MSTTTQEIENLVEEIFDILSSELEADNCPTSTDQPDVNSNKYLSVAMVRDANTVSKKEALILETAAATRENALDHLRNNEIKIGAEQLKTAQLLLHDQDISQEGSLIFSTFQNAADSFFYLKQKKYDKARALMEKSLLEHRELFVNYGHPFEVRRIHLARNIAKIISATDKQIEAFDLSIQLLIYTVTEKKKWPLSICELENPDKISSESKIFLVNQLISEVITILSKNKSEEIKTKFAGLIEVLQKNVNEESKLLLSWCTAYQANLDNNKLVFLKNAKYFFQNHKGLLPRANHFMLTALGEGF